MFNTDKRVAALEARVAELEAELAQAKQKYDQWFHNVPVGLTRATIDTGKHFESNAFIAHIFGYETAADFMAHFDTPKRYVNPEDREPFIKALTEEGKLDQYEVQMYHNDGSIMWLSFSSRIYPEENYLETVVLDVTARKQPELERDRLRQELAEAEAKYRHLYQSAEVGLTRVRARDGRLIEANDAAVRLSGYDNLADMQANFVVTERYAHIEDRNRMLAQLQQTGRVEHFEVEMLRKDGSPLWISYTVSFDETQQYLNTAMIDISKRKRLEQELRQAKEKYQGLYQNAEVGLGRVRLSDSRAVEANEAVAKIFGYDNVEDALANFVASERYARIEDRNRMLAQVQQTGRVENFEAEILRKDGTALWISFTAAIDADGEHLNLAVIDISKRKRLEQELREAEAKYRLRYQHAEVGLARSRVDNGTMVEINEYTAHLFGYDSPADALEHFVTARHYVNPDDRKQMVTQLRDKKRVENFEVEMMRRDGSRFWASLTTSLEPDGQHINTAILDITSRKQAEAERDHFQEELIEAQRRTIRDLSTPIIPVLDKVIIMPLVGDIDTYRAKDFTRTLLAGISRHQAKIVIIDITGVSVVDSGVAGHLNKAIMAARLKGADAIVTGISDAVAEAVVDMGIANDWESLGIETLSTLQAGLRLALKRTTRHTNHAAPSVER